MDCINTNISPEEREKDGKRLHAGVCPGTQKIYYCKTLGRGPLS